MASIVLATLGRAAGTAIGGPIGGQIGATLGSQLGSGFGRTSKRHYEGARLEELAVQTSTYGRMIPITFGTVRIAGNVIWSRPIKEVATTTKVQSGGKGGGSRKSTTTSTQYHYYITLAIAICEGEITTINRVWADAKLLDLSQGTYRIYTGGEDQQPDPLIESYEGVDRTPAYRGLAYVVIEDFPLADFGNRIPNFTFEVTRQLSQVDADAQPVEQAITSVMLIPGSGEFVYDTASQAKLSGQTVSGNVVQQGYQVPLNTHTPEGKANMLVALDALERTFPNLEWVGVVVNWFGTTMDIATCEVWPSVEYQADTATTPNAWEVAGLTRATARQIGDDNGVLRYGGTPDDGSILRLLDELAARELKVFFYPQMLMDVEGKPWRGYLTGAYTDVHDFFTKIRGYNAFILHYANLVDGKVDAFAIGTEMRDLTKITSTTGVFPAVSEFIALASSVKAILGPEVVVTYAADWSEYHHTDGGWYHMDALWASADIDAVGIDAYFPLTDEVQTDYDIARIQAGWTSGEGYDWYYTDPERTNQAPLAPPYAWKNIAWWWGNIHTNPDSNPTAWVPESKPIWFTEYGYASVDGCTNEPNVFIDASAGASAYPRFSRGRVDFMAQRVAIAAAEAQWAGSSMIPQRFLWTWDARPFPYWPDLRDVWADGNNWVTGHWVQGKLGASHVAPAVQEIAARAGLDGNLIDTASLQMMLDGFVIHERVSARAAIEQLMQGFFFTVKEQATGLAALPRSANVSIATTTEMCAPMRVGGGQEVAYEMARQEDLVLPDKLEVHYLDRLQSYATVVEAASRGTQAVSETEALRLSLVIADAHARAIADARLAERWAERSSITLQLPIRYAALEVGDLLEFTTTHAVHRIRVRQVQIGRPGIVRIRGTVDIAETWDGYLPPAIGGDGASLAPPPVTRLEVLDIPALPGDTQDALTLRFAACGIASGWTGATILRELGENDETLATLDKAAIIGTALNTLATGASDVFDRLNTVDVLLLGEETLSSTSELNVLNGANVAVIGDEIIQFTTATALGPGTYRLSTLLRGRLGTEHAMADHAAGERFVLLDSAVTAVRVTPASVGQSWTLRASTFGTSLDEGVESAVTITGESLRPLSPVALSAVKDGSGDILISWLRRARIDGGWRDEVDIPLMEQSEAYDVEILDGAVVVRTFRVTTTQASYTVADQTTDFGSPPDSLSLRIYQLSTLVGRGNAAIATVFVQ